MTTQKTTTKFWIVSILALIWNAMGVFQYLTMQYMQEELAATMTAAENALVEGLPVWHTAAFAIAVFSGLLGSIFLLLKKNVATPLFLISLIAVVLQMGYWVLGTEVVKIMGYQAVIMPVLVIIIAIFLYFFSKRNLA
jgi:phosphate/sulfate permease